MMQLVISFLTYISVIQFLVPKSYAADLSVEYPFGHIKSLGEMVSYLMGPALSIAGIILTIYFVWGAYKMVLSGGDKNEVATAKGMITHSIIGIILLLLMFIIYEFIPEFLGLNLHVIGTPLK